MMSKNKVINVKSPEKININIKNIFYLSTKVVKRLNLKKMAHFGG